MAEFFRKCFSYFLTALSPLCLLAGHEARADVTDYVVVERVVSGLTRPIYVTAPRNDFDRLFIVEQHSGRIRILDLASGLLNPTPFLTVPGLSTGNEQGLLGLAFHPEYETNGFFYVNFTGAGGATNVVRYRVSAANPDIAEPTSAMTILSFAQPQSNHNGGWIGFGPDGFLYINSGDGGGSNDSGPGHTEPGGNAQDITNNLLGKVLRIDVDGDDFPDPDRNYAIPATNPFVGVQGDDEIWTYGLRNPWRASFDRLTGDLYIGDVGQNTREELNFQPGGSAGGENYGWRLREGKIATPTGDVGGPRPPGAIDPVYDYSHGVGPLQGFSVTGGYVYRGPNLPLRGKYFFADFSTARIWSIEHDGSAVTEFIDWTASFTPDIGTIDSISSFGEDATGNLYVVDLDGEVFRVGPACTLDLTLTYSVEGLTMNFVLGLAVPATWTTWMVSSIGIFPLWSLPLPPFPNTPLAFTLPDFPAIGTLGILNVFTTDDGAICVDWDVVDTGGQP